MTKDAMTKEIPMTKGQGRRSYSREVSQSSTSVPTPVGWRPIVVNQPQPRWGCADRRRRTQGSSFLATLGFGAESLWDSGLVTTEDVGSGKLTERTAGWTTWQRGLAQPVECGSLLPLWW